MAKTTDKGERESVPKDHYHDWSPMKGMSESLLNTLSNENEGSVLQRILTGAGNLDYKDILCPFNDGSGCCYKVSCRYKHVPYSAKELRERPKLHTASMSKQEHLCIFSMLPTQILPATGCISKVLVTAASDPGRFYVIPEKGWMCLCSEHERHKTCSSDSDNRGPLLCSNFYDALGKLQTELLRLQRQSVISRKNDFLSGELVAVKLQTIDNDTAWYRAKVLHDTTGYNIDDENMFKPTNVALELIDIGISCVKSSNDIFTLPRNFADVSPLAFKCQLYGISPLMGNWSTSAITQFRDLIQGRNVIAEVVRTASSLATLEDNVVDTFCMVKLYIKGQDNEYTDVAQHLINDGFGIQWNL